MIPETLQQVRLSLHDSFIEWQHYVHKYGRYRAIPGENVDDLLLLTFSKVTYTFYYHIIPITFTFKCLNVLYS